MAYVLNDPLTIEIAAHEIKKLVIDLEHNKHIVTVANLTSDNTEFSRSDLELDIFDDFGNILMPSSWPLNYPEGPEMYNLIKEFLYRSLAEKPGYFGGDGVIS